MAMEEMATGAAFEAVRNQIDDILRSSHAIAPRKEDADGDLLDEADTDCLLSQWVVVMYWDKENEGAITRMSGPGRQTPTHIVRGLLYESWEH